MEACEASLEHKNAALSTLFCAHVNGDCTQL